MSISFILHNKWSIYKCFLYVSAVKNEMKTKIIGTRVSSEVRKTIERLSDSKGISISEYVRQLIISDLDKRSVFTTKLKEQASIKEVF